MNKSCYDTFHFYGIWRILFLSVNKLRGRAVNWHLQISLNKCLCQDSVSSMVLWGWEVYGLHILHPAHKPMPFSPKICGHVLLFLAGWYWEAQSLSLPITGWALQPVWFYFQSTCLLWGRRRGGSIVPNMVLGYPCRETAPLFKASRERQITTLAHLC